MKVLTLVVLVLGLAQPAIAATARETSKPAWDLVDSASSWRAVAVTYRAAGNAGVQFFRADGTPLTEPQPIPDSSYAAVASDGRTFLVAYSSAYGGFALRYTSGGVRLDEKAIALGPRTGDPGPVVVVAEGEGIFRVFRLDGGVVRSARVADGDAHEQSVLQFFPLHPVEQIQAVRHGESWLLGITTRTGCLWHCYDSNEIVIYMGDLGRDFREVYRRNTGSFLGRMYGPVPGKLLLLDNHGTTAFDVGSASIRERWSFDYRHLSCDTAIVRHPGATLLFSRSCLSGELLLTELDDSGKALTERWVASGVLGLRIRSFEMGGGAGVAYVAGDGSSIRIHRVPPPLRRGAPRPR